MTNKGVIAEILKIGSVALSPGAQGTDGEVTHMLAVLCDLGIPPGTLVAMVPLIELVESTVISFRLRH